MSIQLLKNELVKEREEKYKLAKIIRDYENNQSIEKPAENFSGSKMITNPMNEVNLNISFLDSYNNFIIFIQELKISEIKYRSSRKTFHKKMI